MSRFEPSVEPSMEEILASIRRIIAEDTSGSRTVPPPTPPPSRAPGSPVRPGPALKPAPQQRGFMSREAFMKSSMPAEETAEGRFFKPVTPQDPVPAAETADRPVPDLRRTEPAKVETKPIAPAPIVADDPSGKASGTGKPDAVANAPGETQLDGVHAVTIVEAAPKSLAAERKSDAQLIDAQLVELLGEDLKALRAADERQELNSVQTETVVAAAKAVAPEKSSAPLHAEPSAKMNGESTAAPAPAADVLPEASHLVRQDPSETRDHADPFAFDLGPSPFSPRSPSQRSLVEERIAEAAASVPHPPIVAPRSEAAAPASAPESRSKVNGAPASQEMARPTVPLPRSPEPAPMPPPAAVQRPASFAVPSVSATLGPQRRLEPLSDAFKPAPAKYGEPNDRPAADPFPFRTVNASPDLPSVGAPGRDTFERLRPAEPAHVPPPPALPPLDIHANPLIGGDRTMEDAVADLLRPLLKTWLAENMPKIVERALRREMTERLLPGQKNPRE